MHGTDEMSKKIKCSMMTKNPNGRKYKKLVRKVKSTIVAQSCLKRLIVRTHPPKIMLKYLRRFPKKKKYEYVL